MYTISNFWRWGYSIFALCLSANLFAVDLRCGDGVAIDGKQSIENVLKLWKPLAQKGNLCSQIALGHSYFLGATHVERKDGGSIQFYTSKAKKPDFKPAVQYYEMCAEKGSCLCNLNLGKIYDIGPYAKSVSFSGQDVKKADFYYEQVGDFCQNGLAGEDYDRVGLEAKFLRSYLMIFSKPDDFDLGLLMLEDAASWGWVPAYAVIGEVGEKISRMKPQSELARRIFYTVKVMTAQRELVGRPAYIEASTDEMLKKQVEEVMVFADKWYLIAARYNNEMMARSKAIEKKMKPADIQEAHRQAEKFKPKREYF